MNPKTAYQFLKASLEQFTDQEKEELCTLILGKPAIPKRKKKRCDPVPTVAEYEKRLLAGNFFKNHH